MSLESSRLPATAKAGRVLRQPKHIRQPDLLEVRFSSLGGDNPNVDLTAK